MTAHEVYEPVHQRYARAVSAVSAVSTSPAVNALALVDAEQCRTPGCPAAGFIDADMTFVHEAAPGRHGVTVRACKP